MSCLHSPVRLDRLKRPFASDMTLMGEALTMALDIDPGLGRGDDVVDGGLDTGLVAGRHETGRRRTSSTTLGAGMMMPARMVPCDMP